MPEKIRLAPALRKLAVVGNYPPRRCGIATFTGDLVAGLREVSPGTRIQVLPMNDSPEGYAYPPEARFVIDDGDATAYRRAADFLNVSEVDAVCLQHEYGIFGGAAGSYLLNLLRELRMPVVTTLHTVLRNPDPQQRKVLEEVIARSARVVTMSRLGERFLREVYHAPEGRVVHIPHGIHDVPFVDPDYYKDQFGVEGRKVLMTFGLLSPGKGLEDAIAALPAIAARHPEVVYLVVGATHPHVRAHSGEGYRLSLLRLAEKLGVADRVLFHDRFVDLTELMEFIGATDIYVTPYLNPEQITSGTLAYALGAGKAVVSTPYWYAEELLADGRGVLTPFRDPAALAAAVNALLDDPQARNAMRKRAYQHGRAMTWASVAQRYLDCFREARMESSAVRNAFRLPAAARAGADLPEPSLEHLQNISDPTGVLQHASFTIPDYSHGYCLDDNARALLVALGFAGESNQWRRQVRELAQRSLAFVAHAWNGERKRFRNFLGYDRRWLEDQGSEDSHARAVWALGATLGRSGDDGLCGQAAHLFERALPPVREFSSPRAWAFSLLGMQEYLRRFDGDRRVASVREDLGERLFQLYRRHSGDGWRWFEPELTYCNAKLPHALLMAGRWMKRQDWMDTALESLDWLTAASVGPDGIHDPVGSQHPWRRGEPKPVFDQQPIEAYTSCSAAMEAYATTGDKRWKREASRALEWFMGANRLHQPLVEIGIGGCRDGLHPDRVNENQGAESTLAWLLTLLEMRQAAREEG